MLPWEIYDHIVDHADTTVINALARSCSHIAAAVRVHISALADKHATVRKVYVDLISRLPNGMLHGESQFIVYRDRYTVMFELGAATYWRLFDLSSRMLGGDGAGTSWGHTSCPWVVRSDRSTFGAFANNEAIIAYDGGGVLYRPRGCNYQSCPTHLVLSHQCVGDRINLAEVCPMMESLAAHLRNVHPGEFDRPVTKKFREIDGRISVYVDVVQLSEAPLGTPSPGRSAFA